MLRSVSLGRNVRRILCKENTLWFWRITGSIDSNICIYVNIDRYIMYVKISMYFHIRSVDQRLQTAYIYYVVAFWIWTQCTPSRFLFCFVFFSINTCTGWSTFDCTMISNNMYDPGLRFIVKNNEFSKSISVLIWLAFIKSKLMPDV